MRLLKNNEHGNLSLVECEDKNIPAYAILSHTWGRDGEEVTFQNIEEGTKNKVGYEKIKFCRQQTASDGLLHFWVDTCCINRANHTELSEAITSMFRWYHDAAKCYVYLSDVSIHDHDNDSPTERPWESAFRKSRWFRRGWTLQELLAPRSVEFFSREGECLGDRNLLEQAIHEITNIPIAALRGTSMSHFSSNEKMRWVAGRQTKKIEDRAYCLLGIFGVFMYLNYGEGEYAFTRLEQEIRGSLKVSQKYDIPFSLQGVPVIDKFADRPTDLADLGEGLLPSRRFPRRQIFVLSGLGGMGKTQLAAQFARHNHSKYSAVFWLDGSSGDNLKRSIASAATRVPTGQIPKAIRTAAVGEVVDLEAVVEHFLDWLSLPDNDCWLLVIDNVDREYRAQDVQPGAYDITGYFPGADHGSILVTTRLGELEQHGTAGKKLKTVDNELAKAIFCQWYTRKFDEDKGTQLLQLLGGLPLALTQAAAYIQQTGTSFAQYIDLYNTRWKDLMQSQEKDGTPLPQYNRSIWTTWMISFNTIRRMNEAAANILMFWALLDNRDLWYGLFERMKGSSRITSLASPLREVCEDEVAFNSAVGLLLNYGLVDEMENPAGYVVHPVVHQWARHMQIKELQVKFARLAVIIVGLAVPSNSERDFWITQRRLLRHAECCFHWVVNDLVEILKPEAHAGEDGSGHDDNSMDILDALIGLGALYSDQGKLEKAEEIYERALRGCEKALGPEHTSTLRTVHNLGNLYSEQGKLEKAEEMYERALRGYEKALGPEHTSTLRTVNNLGALYSKQGKLEKAEEMYERALRGYEKALGPEHTSTLRTVNNLGALYSKQGKLEKAEEMYERALRGCEKALGPEHTSTLRTVHNLGILYFGQGKLEKAEEMYERALRGYEKALGPEHMSTLRTVHNLGILYFGQGKLEKAEEMYERALRGCEKALGPEHTSTLRTANNLGILYSKQGKLEKAEEMYEQALRGYEKALGPEHTSTLRTANNLGILYSKQWKLEKAEEMYKRALRGYEKALQSDSLASLNTIHGLGLLFRSQGKREEARNMFQRAVFGRKTILGENHPDTIEVVNLLMTLPLTVEEREESLGTNSSGNTTRKRDRWKALLRLNSSRASRS